MKLQVLSYNNALRCHSCKDENGKRIFVDLIADSIEPGYPRGKWHPNFLVGKTVHVEDLEPYEYVAIGVELEQEK